MPKSDRLWEDRINAARESLARYAILRDEIREPFETRLTDLLTDLMHWADLNESDFGEALKMAKIHYNSEK